MNRANASVTVVYTYTSSTAAVATVSAAGMVTAVAPGTTTITVSAAGTGTGFAAATMTSAATITVSDRAPGLTSLQVSPATAALTVGGTQSVTASAQGPRASAATMTYGTSAPAIATVSATGVITAVAAGTATITVTAQSTQDGAFAASSLTGLVTVTVSNPAVVSINISALTQGPTTTSYLVGTTGATGIVSAVNGQSGQAIDINNTRDQIQMTATLATNGARVDSVVAYVANADGTNRTSVGSQSFPSAAASGPVSLYINTADFTANFTAGTAAVKFANGQKRISVSAFSGATELQSTNSQTVNFNNVDGYASAVTAPARSITTAAGVIWHGGGDSTTANMGRAVIVPVFYTPSRVPASLTLAMRQTSATATIAACGSSARNNLLSAPFAARFGGTRAATQASATATAAIGDSTVLDCGTLESADAHVIGVTGGTDNSGTALPLVTYAGGFRTSATVTAPTALKLDYVAPTATDINITRTAPAVTGWVNGSYNFNTLTAASTDAGVGFADLTAGDGKGGRTWSYYGCTTILSTAPTSFTGLASEINDCATNLTATAYTVQYAEADRLVNRAALKTASVGVDQVNPVGQWSSASTAADSIGAAVTIALTPEFYDARSGFIDDASAATPIVAERATKGFIVFANALEYAATTSSSTFKNANAARCYRLDGTTPYAAAASSFMGTAACTASTTGNSVLGAANSAGYRAGVAYSSTTNGLHSYVVTATDKAGNPVTISRKAFRDNTVPSSVVAGAPGSIGTSSNPTVTLTYTDDVKVIGAAAKFIFGVNFDALTSDVDTLVMPYQSLSTPFGTPLNFTATTPVDLTIASPAPFPASFIASGAAASTAYTKATNFYAEARDGGQNLTMSAADAIAGSGITTITASTSVAPVLAVNAAVTNGLSATHTTTSSTGSSVFSRVDFYRRNGTARYEYLGSGTTAVSGVDASSNNVTYTYTIGSYANKPSAAVVQANAQSGDAIVAIGVRSTGAATYTAATFIGGAAVTYTVSGLAAAATASVTVAGGSFTSTQSVVNGTYTVGVPSSGVYSVTTAAVTVGGVLYTVANATQNVTVVGSAAVTATNIVFAAQLIRASITLAGVPATQPTTLTFSQSGQNNVVFTNVATGTNNYDLPAPGTWTATASTVTAYGVTYVPGATTTVAAAIQSTAVAGAATITLASTTYHVVASTTFAGTASATAPSITATPTNTATFTTTATAGVGVRNMATGTTDPGSTAFVAANVTVDGVTYGLASPSQTATPTTAGAAITFAYAAAKTTVAFSGNDIADLTGYTVPIILVGPAGEQVVSAAGAVSATATAAQTLVSAGSYIVKVIPSIVIGASTYSFTSNTVSATYGGTAALVVGVVKTTLTAAVTGTMTSSSTGSGSWTNATIATTRTISDAGLTFDAGATKVWTCIAVTAAGGSTVSSYATTAVDQSNGDCVVTGAGTVTGADVPVIVRLGVTAYGTGLALTSKSVELTYTRSGNAGVSGTFAGTFSSSAAQTNANVAVTRTYTASGLTAASGATITYICSAVTTAGGSTASTLATTAVASNVCTVTGAGTSAAATTVYIQLRAISTGTGFRTDTTAAVESSFSRDPNPAGITGTMSGAFDVTTDWTNATNSTARTLTPSGLTFNAGATTVTWTCTANTAVGGSTASTFITTSVNQTTGVCTLTGAGAIIGSGVQVFIRLEVTGSGAGVITTTKSVEGSLTRTAA